MAISRKALRASAEARKGNTKFLTVAREGELARAKGKPIESNPYAGTDWEDAWLMGWEDESV